MGETLQCLYCMREFDADQVEFFYESERGENDTLFQTFGSRFLDYNMPNRKGFFYRRGQPDVEVAEDVNGWPLKLKIKIHEQAASQTTSSASSIFGDEDEEDMPGVTAAPMDDAHREYVDAHDETRNIVTTVCPHCHSRLPIRDMLSCDTHHVFFLGGTGAGKTTYLIAMLQQLEQTLSRGLKLAAVSFGAESAPYYKALQDQYSSTGTMAATQLKEQTGGRIFPIVMDIESRSAGEKRAFVVLHDFPGEGMGREEFLANLPDLQKTETVIIIGDVNQFYNIDQEQLEDIRCYSSDFDSMFREIRNSAVPAMTASTILGVLLKIDLIMSREGDAPRPGYIAPRQVLQSSDMSMHSGAVDMSTINQVSRTIDENIRHVTGRSLTEHMKGVFEKQQTKPSCYKCFGVSTYTKTESGWSNIYDVSGTKHRVIEPMLFLLAQWGLVDHTEHDEKEEDELDALLPWYKRIFKRRDV